VIELDLDVEDLVGMRFAVSPLMETVMSLRIPLVPTYFVLQMPWWDRVREDVADIDMAPPRVRPAGTPAMGRLAPGRAARAAAARPA
jgi:hypothetical protein